MSAIANRDLTPDSGTSLSKMLQMNLAPYMEQFEAISVGASKEHTLEVNMVRMREDWTDVCFTLTPYRDHGFSILASVDDIQQQLDDQIVKTQTMRGSPFIKPFETQLKVEFKSFMRPALVTFFVFTIWVKGEQFIKKTSQNPITFSRSIKPFDQQVEIRSCALIDFIYVIKSASIHHI